MNGWSFLTRDSGGALILASYHPRKSKTWYWSLTVRPHFWNKGRSFICWQPDKYRNGQWHDRLYIGRKMFMIARQDYHKKVKS